MDAFHKAWLAKPPLHQGLNLFDLNHFNLAGYIASHIEFEVYLTSCDPAYEPQISEAILSLLGRFVNVVGGWGQLKWQVDHNVRALYKFLLDKIKAKPSFKLQAFLHAPIKNRAVVYCDELALQQPHIVQQLYAASAEAGQEGLTPFMAVPTNPHNTFSPSQMLLLYRRQFGLPLATLQSQASLCPGCKEKLDVYGIHLLNCKHISTKDSSDTYNRTIIHDSMGDRVAQICGNKFYSCQTKPSGSQFQPILKNKATGRLDIKYVKRGDEGGKTVLADITIVNPISAAILTGTESFVKGKAIEMARCKKHAKYDDPIAIHLDDKDFIPLPFTVYGCFGHEVSTLLEDIAHYVSSHNTNIPEAVLLRKYRRELAGSLHQGVARLLIARLETLRINSNQIKGQSMEFRTLENDLAVEVYHHRQREGGRGE